MLGLIRHNLSDDEPSEHHAGLNKDVKHPDSVFHLQSEELEVNHKETAPTMIEQLQNMLGTLKPYSIYIAAGVFLGFLLIIWLWRNSRVSAQQNQQYMGTLLQDIAQANNRLVGLEKKIHVFRQQALQYTGETKERVDSVEQEIDQHRQTLKQLKQSLSQCEQTLQTSPDVQDTDKKVQNILQQLEELEPEVEEIQEFYTQLHELESDVKQRLQQSRTRLSQLPEMQAAGLEADWHQAQQFQADFDPISAFSALEELDEAITTGEPIAKTPPVAAPDNQLEADPEAATTEYFSQLLADEDPETEESTLAFEFPAAIEASEASSTEEPAYSAVEAATLEADPDEETPSKQGGEFVLADSWLRDFTPETKAATQEAAVTPTTDDAIEEQAKAQILEEAQALFEVSSAWLETAPLPVSPAEAETATSEPETAAISNAEQESLFEAVAVESFLPATPSETVMAEPIATHPRRKKVIYNKRDKEQAALLSIRHSLQAAGNSLAKTPAQPQVTEAHLTEIANTLQQRLNTFQQETLPALKNSIGTRGDEPMLALSQAEKRLHEAGLLLKQQALLNHNPKRFQVNLERVEQVLEQFNELTSKLQERYSVGV